VAIPPHVLPELKAHLETNVADAPDSLVFASPEGAPLRRSNFNRRIWQPACAAAGLDSFHFHDYADLRVMPTSLDVAWSDGLMAVDLLA
jgi:hypothetical protein